ncbi:MAG: SPOR domain-containing protein [Bacteroidota bacterium]
MRIEGYISDLLYRYNCVVVPGFGAFLTHSQSARFDDKGRFHPPKKSVSFNAQLNTNDGLLVAHIGQLKKLPYDTLLEEIQKVGETWQKRLSNGESILIPEVGKLKMPHESKIVFEPDATQNYLTSSFGLTAITPVKVEREVLKEEVEALEETIPFIITAEQREKTVFRPWLKYAAILLLAFSVGASTYNSYLALNKRKSIARQDAQKEVSRLIQEATFFDSAPLELPAISLSVTKKETVRGKHHIIAGAFRVSENAERKVAQLKEKGFDALYLGTNRFGLHQVAYGSFQDADSALDFLKKIRRTESADAWLLSEK